MQVISPVQKGLWQGFASHDLPFKVPDHADLTKKYLGYFQYFVCLFAMDQEGLTAEMS